MNWIDIVIIVVYFLGLLGVGFYFSKGHQDDEDYFLGGRNIKPWHVGLSVVATDVGGGFSIGLGGLGFTLGLSGSWMLFTGLIGAWISAVVLIPKVKAAEKIKRFKTFNDLVGHYYGASAALIATVISLLGYVGFTSSQFLAGAKLASSVVPEFSMMSALWLTGAVAVLYTSFGGLKAVIYTDTVQWLLLLFGLIFVGIPLGFHFVGGFEAIMKTLPPSYFSLTQVDGKTLLSWALTIMPVWFIGLTLYQRIYACATVKDAQKAWYIAGLLEWPVMAFMGVTLGLIARVAYMQNLFADMGFPYGSLAMDAEMGLPLLLATALPVGFLGLMISAYFSAILSTADSCLMAASGSLVTDLIQKRFKKLNILKLSKWSTGLLGLLALILASQFERVLDLMLISYEVMVSALFVPILWGVLSRKTDHLHQCGFMAILSGGLVNLSLNLFAESELSILWGILSSLLAFVLTYLLRVRSA